MTGDSLTPEQERTVARLNDAHGVSGWTIVVTVELDDGDMAVVYQNGHAMWLTGPLAGRSA